MNTSTLVTSALLGFHTVAAALNVVPAVRSWTPAEGVFNAMGAVIHLAAADAAALQPVAEAFRRDLAAAGCGDWAIASRENPGGGRACVLMLDPEGVFAKDAEGYFIGIGKDAVVVKAATPVGVFYGTRTLLQLLARDPGKPTLPCGEIRDAPQYRHRMLMLDVARKPFPLPVLKDYLRLMAWYKMNELHLHLSDEAFGGLYTGFRVQCDTFPGLASKDLHYTKAELRELQDFARDLGITITPEIDMPGHARCFTDYWPELCLKDHPNYLDVTNPQTIRRMKALLDEMIPVFDAPDFHIGTDEYRVNGTREEKERLHEAFRQFINTMNAHIRSRGKNTRIWSGFEHMLGATQIDPTVIIDMWETDDARGQIARGHKATTPASTIPGNHGWSAATWRRTRPRTTPACSAANCMSGTTRDPPVIP
ncbi:MAG: family 20 glycosylhydrolase [Akkermansiaceae bacterium]|nr:family 20 glycosylhydrolase [Akkermansiaceae bacterium]